MPVKLGKSTYDLQLAHAAVNPWTPVDLIGSSRLGDAEEFIEVVDLCRFFYKTEPVVSTVINKLVEIGINELIFKKKGLSDNEFRLYKAVEPKLVEFAEVMAQEYLLSGLVVPEISYGYIAKEDLMDYGIKKYTKLIVPTSMFVRDPKSISINSSMLTDTPSYYVAIPDDLITFIQGNGTYPDGREDKILYKNLKLSYPEFFKAVKDGDTELPLSQETSKLVFRRKYLTDNAYPIPYIAPILDALKHKRQLRRMDYSIIDKILSAILHISVGDDNFPITDSDEDQAQMDQLRNQLLYRFNSKQNLERIFQLITNHTVKLEWIFPNTDVLLDDKKYTDIDGEIMFGLGFPQILITGESKKTGASNPEAPMISPIKTMENFRRKIITVISAICKEIAVENKFSSVPEVEFKAINMYAFKDFMAALDKAYAVSSISRTSYAEAVGYDFDTELSKLVDESAALQASGLPEFGPTPNSRVPTNSTKIVEPSDTNAKGEGNTQSEDTSSSNGEIPSTSNPTIPTLITNYNSSPLPK